MKNFEEEKNKLLLEIDNLRRSILWYKRTYEENSLPVIILEKVFGKKFNWIRRQNFIKNRVFNRIKINKTNNKSVISSKVLCSIVNHNHNDNTLSLYKLFINYFDTVILDSGSSKAPENAIKYSNIYYSGLLNEAYSIAKKYNYPYLLFICSDVIVDQIAAIKLFDRLIKTDLAKIGVYSPASTGESHIFCKKMTDDELREVPFVEGFMFLCDIEILDCFCPIDTKENLYGWGLDIAKSYFSKKKNKLCVIDDNVEVEHMKGTGYSKEIAGYEMLTWVRTLNNNELVAFFEETIKSVKDQ
jgi:hypothetical protein